MAEQDIAALLDLEAFLEQAPDITRQAMSIALNSVGRDGLATYRKAIRKEVDFPPGYLEDPDRFGQDQRATPSSLVASLVARQRPTSLARFATSGTLGSKGGVSVKVAKQGQGGYFKRGFLVRLRAGTSLDGGNVGLAVRLAPGQQLNKSDTSRLVHLEANVVLLYGPSIDQILNVSVADQETPKVTDGIATEFFRQFARLSNG
jgi:hypothetical protein